MLDQVYGALADPTRRAILGILAEGEVNVGSLAERFPISLNGISKHVKVLERAGLVERALRGREHRLHLNPKPLREASSWRDGRRATSVTAASTWRSSRPSKAVEAHRG